MAGDAGITGARGGTMPAGAGVGLAGPDVFKRLFSEKPLATGFAVGPVLAGRWFFAHSTQMYPSWISLLQILQFATPVLRIIEPLKSQGRIENLLHARYKITAF